MNLRDFIREKLTYMANRATMVASSRESFSAQILLLLEIYGGVDHMEAQAVVRSRRDMFTTEICPYWAFDVGCKALALLDGAHVTNIAGWRSRY